MSDELRWRDEILQLMYWMRAENLGAEVSHEDLNRFLNLTPEQLDVAVTRLLDSGLLASEPDPKGRKRFHLTATGVEEGKRRFSEEFSPYLGREGHLTCDDPNCDCHDADFAGVCRNLQTGY